MNKEKEKYTMTIHTSDGETFEIEQEHERSDIFKDFDFNDPKVLQKLLY